ncbi:MAG TPA: type I DNA topoisomerase, partial [Candidatus Thermoplasmatota archaeon]|nr:type I DNA topoisomerase [Candidatus Thermoplasmatota archaeon]
YGYALSPLLWQKISRGLSAGRVQSAAVRLVVQRERERRAFRAAAYWGLQATLLEGSEFTADLVSVSGKPIATGRDFDKDTGKLLAGRDVLVLDEPQARALADRLLPAEWTVRDVREQAGRRSPAPPFVTSTLQQEANNRLNLSAREAMAVAQRLFEEGYITYHRTDSPTLSKEGMDAARAAVKATFGSQYLSDSPKDYADRAQAGAQEAHEAIRPAGDAFRHPDETELRGKDLEMYRMVWQRTLASQMADKRFTTTTATIDSLEATFEAKGTRVEFAGFAAVYDVEEDDASSLPVLQAGAHPRCRHVEPRRSETKPPARFTEASLVKALVEERIGRPSTYASILETIKDRGYVAVRGKQLVPTFTAFCVTNLLERHFPRLVDLQFTAEMEEKLDQIAAGKLSAEPLLADFFLGPQGLKEDIERRLKTIDPQQAKETGIEGDGWSVKVGRYGAYLEALRGDEPLRATIPESITPAELDEETVERLLSGKAEGGQHVGDDPATGLPILLKEGRFGAYLQLGEGGDDEKPRRSSLPKDLPPSAVTLEDALFLLSLPKRLGTHPEGGDVLLGLGRFGPYIMHERPDAPKPEYRNVRGYAEMRSLTLADAVARLAQPKFARGGGRGAAVAPLRELGAHPEDGEPVQLFSGRYGPYVKHGKTNASIPKDQDPASVTLEQAVDLLRAREAAGGGKKRGSKRATRAPAKRPAKRTKAT